MEIKIADQVLNDFNNSINEIKKSRKVYKRETLNSILTKLHNIESTSSIRHSYESAGSAKLYNERAPTYGNDSQGKLNLIYKYSGGADCIKKTKETNKTA